MSVIPAPINRFRPPVRKPYTPIKPGRAKNMTIAVGFLCNSSRELVIATDRQFTAKGFFKYHTQKLVSNDRGVFTLLYAFAGDPGLAAEVRQKIISFLETRLITEISSDVIRETLEGVIDNLGLRSEVDPPLYLLLGIDELLADPTLVVFNGRGVYSSSRFEIIGCGDTSLIRFLGDHLYNPTMTVAQGIALAGYLIKKATQYVDGCGEPIDVVHAGGLGLETVTSDEVQKGIKLIEAQEEFLSTLLVQTPFQI